MAAPFSTISALVLREVRYKEADRILTLLTAERGIITAKARGAVRKTSRTAAATQQLTYSEMTVFENSGRMTVNEAIVKESFDGLREDFEAFALGCYFAEAAEALGRNEIAEPELMSLTLNALYALSRKLRPFEDIKAAFELRLSSILGYAPDLTCCEQCGRRDPEHPALGILTGRLCCRECRDPGSGAAENLTSGALRAMRQIEAAGPKQFLSYIIDDPDKPCLYRTCENYLAEQTSKRFSTLDYYKSIRAFHC